MAFIRQGNQGLPQYQTSGNLLGTGTQTGQKQPTTAGEPGGWTNIQDYLGANKGDTTNINLAEKKTNETISKGAENVATQAQNLTALPTATPYDPTKINEAFANDQYDIFSSGLNQTDAKNQLTTLPTVNQEISGYAPLEEGVANVDPNKLSSVMQFIGDLAPTSPNYSTGQKSFDAMLLQGSPTFRKDFVPAMKEQYKTMYEQPLKQARDARQTARDEALGAITAGGNEWQQGLNTYLGEQETGIADAMAAQQQHYQGKQADANQDIDALKANYLASTGQEAPQSLVKMWEDSKRLATAWLTNAQAPTQSTAFNQFIESTGDTTRAQDIMALYSALGIAPRYAIPNSDRYSYEMNV